MSELDKEAIEKIDCKLWKNDYYQGLGEDKAFDYRDKVILKYGKLIDYRKPPKETLTREDIKPILIKHWNQKTGVLDFMAFAKEIIDKFGKPPEEKPRFSPSSVEE